MTAHAVLVTQGLLLVEEGLLGESVMNVLLALDRKTLDAGGAVERLLLKVLRVSKLACWTQLPGRCSAPTEFLGMEKKVKSLASNSTVSLNAVQDNFKQERELKAGKLVGGRSFGKIILCRD